MQQYNSCADVEVQGEMLSWGGGSPKGGRSRGQRAIGRARLDFVEFCTTVFIVHAMFCTLWHTRQDEVLHSIS